MFSTRNFVCRAQSGCEICSQTSVGGTQRKSVLQLHMTYETLSTLNLFSCDFWLFPKMKTQLKGSRFQSSDETRQKATAKLNTIPKRAFHRSVFGSGRNGELSVRRQKRPTLNLIRILVPQNN
ncbi:hypothetical protein TNCV_1037941 [Trichonephila clavipes]|nr:hypothetical protein TNCV_1037941 [Trichonephila clavipes]